MPAAPVPIYRAVDIAGQTLDCLLTADCDQKTALGFFKTAVQQHGLPAQVTLDKGVANTAALEVLIEDTKATSKRRQNPYLNNLVEQAHRVSNRIVSAAGGSILSCQRVRTPGRSRNETVLRGTGCVNRARPDLRGGTGWSSMMDPNRARRGKRRIPPRVASTDALPAPIPTDPVRFGPRGKRFPNSRKR